MKNYIFPLRIHEARENILDHVGYEGIPTLAIGAELEVELLLRDAPTGMSRYSWLKDNAQEVVDLGRGFCLAKQDGSLRNGIEFVSPPEEIEDSRERMTGLVQVLRDRCQTSHRTGLHVHVNKEGFEDGKHLTKFLTFFCEMPEPSLISIAGRSRQLGLGARRYRRFDEYASLIESQKHLSAIRRSGYNMNPMFVDKYALISVRPRTTVEVRMFASTLNPYIIAARLEAVCAAREWTRIAEVDTSYKTFLSWLEDHGKEYPAFLRYCKRRTIKEPLESAELRFDLSEFPQPPQRDFVDPTLTPVDLYPSEEPDDVPPLCTSGTCYICDEVRGNTIGINVPLEPLVLNS